MSTMFFKRILRQQNFARDYIKRRKTGDTSPKGEVFILFQKNKKSIFIGFITGFANGLFGSGGGTIVVPCLQRILGVETHKSHATAIAIILPLSILSMFIYLGKVEILWGTVFTVSIGGILGGYVGAKLLTKLSGNWLHKVFGLFMLIAAVRMVVG